MKLDVEYYDNPKIIVVRYNVPDNYMNFKMNKHSFLARVYHTAGLTTMAADEVRKLAMCRDPLTPEDEATVSVVTKARIDSLRKARRIIMLVEEREDNKGKVIANFHEGKYYIGNKEVSLEKFQKFANKNGDIITINYSPEINTIKAKGTVLPDIKTHDILTKNLEKIKIEPQEAPIPKKYTRKHLTPEFYNRVIDIAEKIKCKPEDLLAVMNSESGLNPSSISRWTGATSGI